MTTPTGLEKDLQKRKAVLLGKLAGLEKSTLHREDLAVEQSPDELDAIRLALDRDVVVHQLNHTDRLICDIRSALQGIDAGEYGICADCEEPISERRLAAVPWAQLCVRCQDLREQDQGARDGWLEAA
jgi:DnaK suppressor protein